MLPTHHVPDFEPMDDAFAASGAECPRFLWPNSPSVPGQDIMELLWLNGQAVAQNHKPLKKGGEAILPDQTSFTMKEDEWASWIAAYPLDDDDLFSTAAPPLQQNSVSVRDLHDGLYDTAPPPPPTANSRPSTASQAVSKPENSQIPQNFSYFSRLNPRAEQVPIPVEIEATVAESNDSPFPPPKRGLRIQKSAESRPNQESRTDKPPETVDRKRKGRVEVESPSEGFDGHGGEAWKQDEGSPRKRIRSSQVHCLSERKRRGRINEKMKALQQLIPCCTKADKASLLDEAIRYMKSLQYQLQMMSSACGVLPMMLPGMLQQYMGVGMNRPPFPFRPPMDPNSAMAGPRFPMMNPFQAPRAPFADAGRHRNSGFSIYQNRDASQSLPGASKETGRPRPPI